MSSCLELIFFCCTWREDQTIQNSRRNSQKKKKATSTPKKLITKFKKQECIMVPDECRKNGQKFVYCCPICYNYYTKILACSECKNFICIYCFQKYQSKTKSRKQIMKCSFCFSIKSIFIDYQNEAHSYFDSTNKGFLSQEERKKIDQQLQNNKVQPIQQEPQSLPGQRRQ